MKWLACSETYILKYSLLATEIEEYYKKDKTKYSTDCEPSDTNMAH